MEKKTIGKFIAVLRKASGMTQKELGERLYVSDKTVSRWECDECTPELSLIPAIAEIFGVSCDELLRGERVFVERTEHAESGKSEKQLKAIISRVTSGFKTLIFISLAIAAVGLVCMLGISYGFYRPVIGFFVMLLFEICAFGLAALAVSRSKDVMNWNELFMSASEDVKTEFGKTLGEYSFTAFLSVFVTVALSIPLVAIRDYNLVESVFSFDAYGPSFMLPILLLSAYFFFIFKLPYCEWITYGRVKSRIFSTSPDKLKRMNILQLGFVMLATLLFFVAPSLEIVSTVYGYDVYDIFLFAPVLCLVADIVIFIVFMVKNKELRSKLIFPGIRNLLMIIPSLIVNMSFGIYYEYENGVPTASVVSWNNASLWSAVVISLLLFLLCSVITRAKEGITNKTKNKSC